VIACLANSKNKREEAALRAEKLLHDMKRRWKAGDRLTQPTTHSYNSVMNAWARAGEPRRADEIFREMLEDYKNGNDAAKPQTSTFNSKCLLSPICFAANVALPTILLSSLG